VAIDPGLGAGDSTTLGTSDLNVFNGAAPVVALPWATGLGTLGGPVAVYDQILYGTLGPPMTTPTSVANAQGVIGAAYGAQTGGVATGTVVGTPPALGVRVNHHPQGGVVVTEVEPDGPAARAGLQVGDRILALNGVAVDTPETMTRFIDRGQVGQPVAVQYLRGQQIRAVETALTAHQALFGTSDEQLLAAPSAAAGVTAGRVERQAMRQPLVENAAPGTVPSPQQEVLGDAARPQPEAVEQTRDDLRGNIGDRRGADQLQRAAGAAPVTGTGR
jgi:hypothetical protein